MVLLLAFQKKKRERERKRKSWNISFSDSLVKSATKCNYGCIFFVLCNKNSAFIRRRLLQTYQKGRGWATATSAQSSKLLIKFFRKRCTYRIWFGRKSKEQCKTGWNVWLNLSKSEWKEKFYEIQLPKFQHKKLRINANFFEIEVLLSLEKWTAVLCSDLNRKFWWCFQVCETKFCTNLKKIRLMVSRRFLVNLWKST